MLPIGLSEELSTSRVKTYCPRCQEVYVPRQKHLDIDGAYFGTSFANVLFKTFPELYPKDGPLTYLPTIYGFKIFGQKGSAYELRYDNVGVPLNKQEIDAILKKKTTGMSATTAMPLMGQQPTTSQMQSHLLQASGSYKEKDIHMKDQN